MSKLFFDKNISGSFILKKRKVDLVVISDVHLGTYGCHAKELLVYLSSWYWSWIEYRLVFTTNNIADPNEKLKKAIAIVTEKIEDDAATAHINESILNKIIIAEFTKAFHTKEVDKENKEDFFYIYKSVINRIVVMINNVNPDYPYAKSLVSNIVEGALHQHFLQDHLKTITNCNEKITPTDFYLHLVENTIRK